MGPSRTNRNGLNRVQWILLGATLTLVVVLAGKFLSFSHKGSSNDPQPQNPVVAILTVMPLKVKPPPIAPAQSLIEDETNPSPTTAKNNTVVTLMLANIENARSTEEIRIRLLPDYSRDSTEFWQAASEEQKCHGRIYRSEKGFLIQGRVDCGGSSTAHKKLKAIQLGPCPPEANEHTKRKHGACPEHDLHCGCHGPVMVQGMVGWAGGHKGPDFFIYTSKEDARGWHHDHTVFGIVDRADVASWETIRDVSGATVRKTGRMLILQQEIKFQLR